MFLLDKLGPRDLAETHQECLRHCIFLRDRQTCQ